MSDERPTRTTDIWVVVALNEAHLSMCSYFVDDLFSFLLAVSISYASQFIRYPYSGVYDTFYQIKVLI